MITFNPSLPSFKLTVLDLLLPPILISTSYLLNIIYNEPTPTSSSSTHHPINAHIYQATTSHARFLPIESKHIFSYPVLFLGVNLTSLESNQLDLSHYFAYNPKKSKWCLTQLRSEGYLNLPSVDNVREEKGMSTTESNLSIRKRIWEQLDFRGIDLNKAEVIYMVTMPAYLGLEGINPLTVHFCYGNSSVVEEGTTTRGKLEIVVLEVHNTFGERHLYVLETGFDEDEVVPETWEHRWTFPRAFHVSPFNDRQGFYRVSLRDPLKSSSTSPTPPSFPSHPELALKIIYLTPSDKNPAILEKKIYASLGGPGKVLNKSNLLKAVLKFPFSLLFTTPRILFQALLLHYFKALDVYPRPEPFTQSSTTADEDDEKKNVLGDLEEKLNPVEKGGKKGSVGWQSETSSDRFAREKIVNFLSSRIKDLKGEVKVIMKSSDDSVNDIILESSMEVDESTYSSEIETLTISYLTPLFYTDLLVAPSIPLALSLNNTITHRWRTSNDSLFLKLFSTRSSSSTSPSWSPSSSSSSSSTLFINRLANSIRLHLISAIIPFPLTTLLSLTSSIPNSDSHPRPSQNDPLNQFKNHPLNDNSFSLLKTLIFNYLGVKIGYGIFWLTRARFIVGTESWGEWDRWRLFKEREMELMDEKKVL